MKLIYLLFILFFFVSLCSAQKSANEFYKFSDCQASSTYSTGGGVSEFDAHNALQPGKSYWSSRGSHSPDEIVTWTGILPAAAYIEGLKINWAYAPEEVQVAVSPNGESFHPAISWKRTPSNDASFTEDIYFDHAETAKAVMISMRNAIHDYFGINEIFIMGSGEPLLMIISGITSPKGEMCLQVEEGQINKEGAEVVLDSCAAALASGDGRELWRQNDNQQLQSARSKPSKCATLYGGNVQDGGKIVLTDCMRALEGADGSSNWSFEANSQLRLQKKGSYCLSQKNVNGNTAGLGDIIKTLGATAKVTSTADANHGAEKAIDNNLETYYATKGFDDANEHLVNFDLDLGKEVKLGRLRIDWEFPALSYTILTSKDGQTYAERSKNEANPSNYTLDTLNGAPAQHVRISMYRPHPQYAKSGDKYIYGIREINVLANNLQSIIADCREAANTDDVRDKYFVEYTTEFDETLAKKLNSMENDVLSRIKQINELSKELEDEFPQMDACLNVKSSYDEKLKKLTGESKTVSEQLINVTKGDVHPITHLSPGDTLAFPAEDCYVIKNNDVNATSGFYWILPKCAKESLRMYCDMENDSSFYVWNGSPPMKPGTLITDKVNSVEDIRLHCAEVGLEPVILRSINQLKSLEAALEQMGIPFNGKGAIPLGYDYGCAEGRCNGKYGDLVDGATDVTAVLLSKSISNFEKNSNSNTVGLELSATATVTSFFDIGYSEIVAVVCSTNTFDNESEMSHLDITCDTTAEDNDAFNGVVNTNIIVECPPGCEESCSDVFGSEGVYAAKSRICCAALHAGLIQKGGMVNVALESGRISYDGSKQNGIESKALTSGYHKSIRVGPLSKDCPIERFEIQPSSFIEAVSMSSTSQSLEVKETPEEKKEDVFLEPTTARLIDHMLGLIDEIHGVDANVVIASLEDAANVIAKTRKHLKPAEKLQKHQMTDALQLFMSIEDLANTLYDTSGTYYLTLEQLNNHLEELAVMQIAEQGFNSFRLDYGSTTFSDAFEVIDSVRSKNGPSEWGYSQIPIEGRSNAIVQKSHIFGLDKAQGTFAILKHHKFFDTVTNVDFFAHGGGKVGIAFKVRNINNMFLVEFDQKEGSTRVYRVLEGDVTLINEVHNGGYLQGKWFHVQIETTQGKVTIFASEVGQKLFKLFNFLDENFIYGKIGLFSSGVENGVFFDNINIKAKPCIRTSKIASLNAPRCSYYNETYFGSIQYVFQKSDHNTDSSGAWKFKENVGGRKKVIAQLNAVKGLNNVGTNLILKKHTLCKDGYVSFDFFPECPKGGIGSIFRYKSSQNYYVVEVFPSEMRIRNIIGNKSKELAKTRVSVSLNKWHNLALNFENRSVWATLRGHDGHKYYINVEDIGSPSHDGQVGLTAVNCAGVAFDHFQVSPFEIEQDREADRVIAHEKKAWQSCSETIHLLERRDMCHSMFRQEPQYRQVSCSQNFCVECCRYHTSLLKSTELSKCIKSCKLNDVFAQSIKNQFLSTLSSCLNGKGPAFEHCSEGNASCQLEACYFCCASSEGVKDIETIPADLIKGSSEREITECKYQCGNKFVVAQ